MAEFRIESEDGQEVIREHLSRADAIKYLEDHITEPIRMVRIGAREDDDEE